MSAYRLIDGTTFTDQRGTLNFFDQFQMDEVVRFYEISHSSNQVFRGWQGHAQEKKWFYCIYGAFIVYLVKLDNFDAPRKHVGPNPVHLSTDKPLILEVPGGYCTGIVSSIEGSRLMVFSNFSVEESKRDDFRFPQDCWELKL